MIRVLKITAELLGESLLDELRGAAGRRGRVLKITAGLLAVAGLVYFKSEIGWGGAFLLLSLASGFGGS